MEHLVDGQVVVDRHLVTSTETSSHRRKPRHIDGNLVTSTETSAAAQNLESLSMFKGLGNIATLMQQAQQMNGQIEKIQERLKDLRVTGSAGAGLVEVEANGKGEVLHVRLDADLVAKGDREMLEDLLPAAINDAKNKAQLLHAEEMKGMAAGLDVPGLQDALSKFNG
jgi:DNA-binding YbaB/EbfC family protein